MIAYNPAWLYNLNVTKSARRWARNKLIAKDLVPAIEQAFPSGFYHPNIFIRILLFIATLVALGGVTGLFALVFISGLDEVIEVALLFYGAASWVVLETVLIKRNHHYKSGVNEALLYHSIGWVLGGFGALVDFEATLFQPFAIALLVFAAIRYADLICTAAAFAMTSYFLFDMLYSGSDTTIQIIPFVFIAASGLAYAGFAALAKDSRATWWSDVLTLAKALSLVTAYLAGNYFVVREMSSSMMNVDVAPGGDIPFAWVFYTLTVCIPVLYLYIAIRKKDVIFLRVSLLAVGMSAFTFKYYFSLGHPEVTLTVAGLTLMIIAAALHRFLRQPRNGFTRGLLMSEAWADRNLEAAIISQTMGGNKAVVSEPGGGGTSAGGGSADGW